LDELTVFDQDMSVLSNSLFRRQVSAPVRLSKGLFTRQVSAPVRHLPICEESVPELSDPEWEPDEEDGLDKDPFQSIAAPARQISLMSDSNAKGPSRQVTSMSNLSSQDWEPIGASSLKRQATDEQWPTWYGKDLLIDSEQLGAVSHDKRQAADQQWPTWLEKDSLFGSDLLSAISHDSKQHDSKPLSALSQPHVPTWMPPSPTNYVDMPAAPPSPINYVDMPAMPAAVPQLYIWQLPPQTKQPESTLGQPPFQRKRESLIDLAKQRQQEQQAANAGDDKEPSGIKFCPWCGGSFQPNFKFCVFCGNQFSARTSSA
jgi:hypothetical protein